MARNQSFEGTTPGIIERGAHRIWAGVGAAGGAVAGAAIGAVAGPFGAVVGLMACAVAGGLAGRGVADKMEPTVEGTYSREHCSNRSPGENNISYAYRPRAESPSDSALRDRDRNKKYLEVESGFAARLREAQAFRSNLG